MQSLWEALQALADHIWLQVVIHSWVSQIHTALSYLLSCHLSLSYTKQKHWIGCSALQELFRITELGEKSQLVPRNCSFSKCNYPSSGGRSKAVLLEGEHLRIPVKAGECPHDKGSISEECGSSLGRGKPLTTTHAQSKLITG